MDIKDKKIKKMTETERIDRAIDWFVVNEEVKVLRELIKYRNLIEKGEDVALIKELKKMSK